MKERSIEAMPPCFEKWCARFDDLFRTKPEKREFRHYLAGLLGESKRKNLSEIARNSVGVIYHRLTILRLMPNGRHNKLMNVVKTSIR